MVLRLHKFGSSFYQYPGTATLVVICSLYDMLLFLPPPTTTQGLSFNSVEFPFVAFTFLSVPLTSNVHQNHLEGLFEHRLKSPTPPPNFWFSKSGMGPENLDFYEVSRCSWCYWSGGHLLDNSCLRKASPSLHLLSCARAVLHTLLTHFSIFSMSFIHNFCFFF